MTGINAEVRIGDPSVCQVASVSRRAATVSSITRGRLDDGSEVVEEFVVDGDGGLCWSDGPETELMFAQGDRSVHRFSRAPSQDCVCEIVERSGCTVRNARAVDGALVVTFFATEVDTVRSIVADLRAAHQEVRLRRLTRSADGDDSATTVVDLGVLTDRQREVLGAAYEHGYFEHPRGGNAADVAEALDIAVPTFTEHLAAAQRNLLDELLDEAARSAAGGRA